MTPTGVFFTVHYFFKKNHFFKKNFSIFSIVFRIYNEGINITSWFGVLP
jgi:hypothetical protein